MSNLIAKYRNVRLYPDRIERGSESHPRDGVTAQLYRAGMVLGSPNSNRAPASLKIAGPGFVWEFHVPVSFSGRAARFTAAVNATSVDEGTVRASQRTITAQVEAVRPTQRTPRRSLVTFLAERPERERSIWVAYALLVLLPLFGGSPTSLLITLPIGVWLFWCRQRAVKVRGQVALAEWQRNQGGAV